MMLVLASKSPRRRQLLGLFGCAFDVIAAEVDEGLMPGEKPREYVLRLAEEKTRAVASQVSGDVWVIGADTIVVENNDAGKKILGKPSNRVEAEDMLRRLRGRTHKVYTALAVLSVADNVMHTDWCATDVPMRNFSDGEMRAYIDSGDPLDKAGAYAIQHTGFQPVENMTGCFANVVGLPLCHLKRTMKHFAKKTIVNIPEVCQDRFQYQCPIYPRVLAEDIS